MGDQGTPVIEKNPEQAAALVQPPTKEDSANRDGAEWGGTPGTTVGRSVTVKALLRGVKVVMLRVVVGFCLFEGRNKTCSRGVEVWPNCFSHGTFQV